MPRTRQPKLIPAAAPKRAFALSSRYAAETAIVTITDPAAIGQALDTGLRIEIKSLYSPEARDAIMKANAELAADADRSNLAIDFFEQTVAITVRWWHEDGPSDGLLETPDGAPTPCTPENVRRIYGAPETAWLQKQVQAAYLDLGRFFPTPKAHS